MTANVISIFLNKNYVNVFTSVSTLQRWINPFCYIAGIFSPTARALIRYFEVTWHLTIKEGLNGVKRVAWNIQKINRVSWKREKINRVSWIIFVQITVLFVEGLNGVKRVAWNIQKINRVPCLLHPHWDPHKTVSRQKSLSGQHSKIFDVRG